jgi:hypothetical protein
MVPGTYGTNMKEANAYPNRDTFPTSCKKCGTKIRTEPFRNSGRSSKSQPHGHKDPRHAKGGCYCSISCSKEDGGSGTTYPKA